MTFQMADFETQKILKKNKKVYLWSALRKCDCIFSALFVNELFWGKCDSRSQENPLFWCDVWCSTFNSWPLWRTWIAPKGWSKLSGKKNKVKQWTSHITKLVRSNPLLSIFPLAVPSSSWQKKQSWISNKYNFSWEEKLVAPLIAAPNVESNTRQNDRQKSYATGYMCNSRLQKGITILFCKQIGWSPSSNYTSSLNGFKMEWISVVGTCSLQFLVLNSL